MQEEQVKEKKVEFLDILNYVPNDRKECFIKDIVLFVPELKDEADKFINHVPNLSIGKNREAYISLMKEVGMFVYNATNNDKSRKIENVSYRQLVCWMISKTLPFSLQGIGTYFSNKNHSTILHSIKKFEQVVETSWKDRMLVSHFVDVMEEKGYMQPKLVYNELLINLKIKNK